MLKLHNISKTFHPGTVNEKKALTDLSLELNKGDFVTILGSNGAGKSTLFNAIAGKIHPVQCHRRYFRGGQRQHPAGRAEYHQPAGL